MYSTLSIVRRDIFCALTLVVVLLALAQSMLHIKGMCVQRRKVGDTLKEASSGITACSSCSMAESSQPVSLSPSIATVILSRSISTIPGSTAGSAFQESHLATCQTKGGYGTIVR